VCGGGGENRRRWLQLAQPRANTHTHSRRLGWARCGRGVVPGPYQKLRVRRAFLELAAARGGPVARRKPPPPPAPPLRGPGSLLQPTKPTHPTTMATLVEECTHTHHTTPHRGGRIRLRACSRHTWHVGACVRPCANRCRATTRTFPAPARESGLGSSWTAAQAQSTSQTAQTEAWVHRPRLGSPTS
jgi:hypothetical protein